MSFLAGVRESGFHDLQEVEAACLMKVLAKPELENHIILNELALIMENFGVQDNHDQIEGEDDDDYIPDTDSDAEPKEQKEIEIKEETKDGEAPKQSQEKTAEAKKETKSKICDKVRIDDKGQKILTKLARFLLK